MDLIVLGVDGVDPEYLEEAIKKRDMPNWRKLKDNSFYSELPSTLPSITVPAWQVMFSGYDPGRFNAFHMSPFDYEEMEQKLRKSSSFRGDFIWDKTDLTFSLHYVPGTSPVYPIEGWMRSGFPGPATYYPDELADEVEDLEGSGYERERKTAELMMDKESDVFISVVRMTDRESHHANTASDVLDIYERTDDFLEKVLEKAEEEDANLLVVSDHGFMHASRKFNVSKFLEQRGLLEFSEDRETSNLYKIAQPLLNTPLKIPLKKLHEFYSNYSGEKINDTEQNILSTIRADSKVLPSWKPVGRDFGLKINTEDMPHGKVSEEEKNDIIEEICQELDGLEDGGRKVVEDIWRGEEIYSECSRRPEIVFRTTQDFVPAILTSNMEFVNTSSFTHDVNGVFFAKGPNIEESAELDIDIYSVAPLIYALLNEEIPDDLKGELPEELLKEVKVNYISDELKGLDF